MHPTKSFTSLLELFLLREYPRGSFLSVSPQFYQQVIASAPVVQAPVGEERLRPVVEIEKTVAAVQSEPELSKLAPEPPVVLQVPVEREFNKAVVSAALPEQEEVVIEDTTENSKWKRFFATHYPQVQLREEILSDALAKQQKELYRATVFLLLGEAEEASLSFFQKIADAITARFRFAICLKREAWKEKARDRSWKERGVLFLLSQEAERWLRSEGITLEPALSLEAAEVYQREPQKKAPLWQAISSHLCRLQK